jgi:hypothetical protein
MSIVQRLVITFPILFFSIYPSMSFGRHFGDVVRGLCTGTLAIMTAASMPHHDE